MTRRRTDGGHDSNLRGVDSMFETNLRYQGLGPQQRRAACAVCGYRHSPRVPCIAASSFELPSGRPSITYEGTARVRVVPPGLTGGDLAQLDRGPRRPDQLRTGQLWAGREGVVFRILTDHFSLDGHTVELISADGTLIKIRRSALLSGRRWRFVRDAEGQP